MTSTASKARRSSSIEAGTQVVWDVDPIAAHVDVYRAAAPDRPQRYVRAQELGAEPAVPGWRVAVGWIFG
jgi:Uma2 family endonuclease